MSLRFIGDTLDPDEVTRLLGVVPNAGERRGGIIRMPNGKDRVARTGAWRIEVERRSPADVPLQVAELLAPMTLDLDIWADLARRYRAEIFCGLFLTETNQGMALPPETLRMLADRHLTIDFDIYNPSGN